MEEIFGVDTNRIVVGVVVGFALIVGAVGLLALLNRIVLKIGLRNIPRRPAQTSLIVVGLMLSTLIISSALGTGDTINHSIRNEVTKGLGEIDEILTSAVGDSFGLTGSSPYFPTGTLDDLRAQLSDDDRIDGLMPIIAERAPVSNPASGESVGRLNVTGIDTSDLGVFGPVLDANGKPLDVSMLSGGGVFINEKAAESLEASVGDTLTMFLQSGTYDLSVVAIASDGGLAGDDETVLVSLAQAQAFFGHPGEVNSVLVSNRGGEISGADLSEDVTELLRSLLTNEDAAREIKTLLGAPEVVTAIRKLAENQTGAMKEDLLETADLLEADGLDSKLVSNLADDGIGAQALIAFESTTEDPAQLLAAFTLFSELKILTSRTSRPIC